MIKHEFDSFSEFEEDFHGAKAVLETLAEAMFAPCASKEYAKTVEAAIRLLESAEAWLDGGRVHGIEGNDEEICKSSDA